MSMRYYIYITPFFPSPSNWRGAYCYDFVRALERNFSRVGAEKGGIEHWKALVFVPGAGADYEIGGVKVYRFPVKELPSGILPFLFSKWNQRSFLKKLVEGSSHAEGMKCGIGEVPLCSENPTPLHFYTANIAIAHANTARLAIYSLSVKKLNPNCKTLLHHHDLASFGLNLGVLRHCSIYNAWLFCQFRKLFEQIDTHVFISEASRKSFLSAPDTSWTIYEDYKKQMRGLQLFHCRPARIKDSIILHNGVDTEIFRRVEVETCRGGEGKLKPFVIGCIGNFIDLKDQETLIRAVALIMEKGNIKSEKASGIEVRFVGTGPLLEHCKALAKEVEEKFRSAAQYVRYIFLPEMRHEELPDFYRGLDLFVLPSYFEGFGCVYTEAWSCGVPFIACKGQGMDDLIAEDDRSLWLCRPRDVKGLAQKIRRCIEDSPNQKLTCAIGITELVQGFIGLVEDDERMRL